MTENQEHLITLLFVKYGGLQNLLDTWLFDDTQFSTEEVEAVNVWLADDHIPKPMNATVHKATDHTYLTVDISLDPSDDG